MNSRIRLLLAILLLLVTSGCTAADLGPVTVDDSPSVKVEVTSGGNFTISGGSVTISGGNISISGGTISTTGSYIGYFNETGVSYGPKQADGVLRVVGQDYLQALAEGDIPEHKPWTKMGISPASTITESTLWELGTQYIWPTVAQRMEVVSTHINDTAAGYGARSVYINYLTDTFEEKTEILALGGVGVVTTVATDIYRVNYFSVTSVGGTGKPEGNIYIRALSDTPIFSYISVGYNRARSICYTVPLGYTLYISSISFSCGYKTAGKTVRFTTQATYDPIRGVALGPNFFMPYTEILLIDDVYAKTLEVPTRFPAGTDIKVSIIGETLAICTVSLRGWLEE